MFDILSIDVEDYFQVDAFSNAIRPQDWDSYEPRVERNTYRLLDLLDCGQGPPPENQVSKQQATFFVLGWIAERHPGLVKEIHARGHEVASHGYAHQCIFNQTRDEFRKDIRKTKGILQDLIGAEVSGYRAPTYSITENTLWALPILIEEGYKYDSSIFSVRHDRYGIPDAPHYPFYIDIRGDDIVSQFRTPKYINEIGESKTANKKKPNRVKPGYMPVTHRSSSDNFLIEFPLSTLKFLGQNIPIAGGGYFRLFPIWFTKWAWKRFHRGHSAPFIFYLHPWEIDPEQPRVKGISLTSRFRHYINLNKTEDRLKRILRSFQFMCFQDFVKRVFTPI